MIGSVSVDQERKNAIIVPFAFNTAAKSGEQVKNMSPEKKLGVYLQNACVALVSAKRENPESEVLFITDIEKNSLPNEIVKILNREGIIYHFLEFTDFNFGLEYRWSLAFYKLCAIKETSNMNYRNLCCLDSDVFIQGSFEYIWKEAEQHIMLYDLNHGLKDEVFFKEVMLLLNQNKWISHYGGEFFAASSDLARRFIKRAEDVFETMHEKHLVVTTGDEYITSIVASQMPSYIKNAGAYVYRYWTGRFRRVSDNYRGFNIVVLHVPAEKDRGMLKLYKKYVCGGGCQRKKVWKILHISKPSPIDTVKRFIRN